MESNSPACACPMGKTIAERLMITFRTDRIVGHFLLSQRTRRQSYLAALTIAMPHGPSPTLMRCNSRRDFKSTTETSFEAPFAVYSFDPVGSSAIPQARFPTGIVVVILLSAVSIIATPFPRPVDT